jgi:glucose dehydrogenase
LKPPPFGRMSFKMEDLVTAEDTTPEHAAACRDLVEKSGGVYGGVYNEGPFTPWVYRAPGAPPVSSVIFPGAIGGTNWGGTASDPNLGYVFTFTNEYGSIGWIQRQMTYQGKNGKQYVAVVAGDGGAGVTDPPAGNDESLVVFTLP